MSIESMAAQLAAQYDAAVANYARTRDAEALYQAKQAALSLVGAEDKRISGVLAQPPSERESEIIAAMSTRSNMTLSELDGLLDTYRGHQAQRAILDAATRAGIISEGATSSLEDEAAAIRARAQLVEKAFSPYEVGRAAGSPPLAVMMRAQLADTTGAVNSGDAFSDLSAMLGGR